MVQELEAASDDYELAVDATPERSTQHTYPGGQHGHVESAGGRLLLRCIQRVGQCPIALGHTQLRLYAAYLLFLFLEKWLALRGAGAGIARFLRGFWLWMRGLWAAGVR